MVYRAYLNGIYENIIVISPAQVESYEKLTGLTLVPVETEGLSVDG